MPYKDSKKRHTYIYKKGFLLKVCHAVTIWLQSSDVAWQPSPSMIEWVQRKEERASRREAGSLSEADSPYIDNWIAVLGNDTILAKYAKMAKAGACQKMETLAVVAKERYLKTGNPILYRKWKRGNKNAIWYHYSSFWIFGCLPFDL